MDYRGDRRPPRSVRPASQQSPSRSQPPPFPDIQHTSPSSPYVHGGHSRNVSFVDSQIGDQLDAMRPRNMPSAYQRHLNVDDPEATDPAKVGRKKSLVRPEREKIEPGHRQWHYRSHVFQAEDDGQHRIGVMPSTTGNFPQGARSNLRRGKSLLGREQDQHESGLTLFKTKRSTTLRRKFVATSPVTPTHQVAEKKRRGCWTGPGPGGPWMTYCLIVTCLVPSALMNACGLSTPERQRAWREKMGLISVILFLMAAVGFLTFGFTEAVCGTPPNRFHGGAIGDGFIGKNDLVIHGYNYDFSKFRHPKVGIFDGDANPVLAGGWGAGGNDASFLFQKVNQQCLGLITRPSTSNITGSGNNMDWYFPCNIYGQQGNKIANFTGYGTSTTCHISRNARTLVRRVRPLGQVYYTWEDVQNPRRNLAVYESTVLDLNMLNWLNRTWVNYPPMFDRLKSRDGTYNGKDLSMLFSRTNNQRMAHCLQDIATIGFIDTKSIGCVASSVVLILSLIFIVGVVAIRFVMAVMFSWFFSWKLGNFRRESYQQRMQRSAEIENWSSDIYRPAPSEYRPNVGKNGLRKKDRKTFLPNTSRFTPSETVAKGQRPGTAYGSIDGSANWRRATVYSNSGKVSSKGTSSNSLPESPCPFQLHNVVPQPPHDYEPFGFPLAHTICLVTAYSESIEGLRTTLDSLATTDYPNSHKLILVIADGMVRGTGNELTTPEIVLSMMKEFVVAPTDVEPHSYVAIADGHKRHNMARVFAGFYDYDDRTVERSKQQRIPIVLVAKCGNPLEVNDPRPGNRGKRDSQIVIMGFLQKVMFDERMTTFEYEFFNSIWRVTGVSPDRYELILCVDADTKVFPDSLTKMASCMVLDEEIMGLCGETKIANKAETFITMIQVFEYYISHHLTKAFESMFGGVTCLPGCFSMYRIKAPKGESGYWVPILANPDVVEHYSENIVDTLHKKNLLLLGEDRYLTTLMLKTFPKRKNMFCPQAVCKTVVPDTFRVLLSQRRRWINSTIHNLAELVLVRDLCGTFCFSMQFVVGMELAGTLVLPAAITFTVYLIIISIIPGGADTTIPLVLLAIVLGLPGLLIVVTSRKVAYIGWMLIYLMSLPIWNGVLPAYAFWHFDDFSWGQTRKVQGETGGHTGDKEGEFDSTHIVMKRWAEFERDRRWKSGTASRDSEYTNEKKEGSNRYSTPSNSDLTHPMQSGGFDGSTLETSNFSGPRPQHNSNTVLMLPAPLSVTRPLPSSASLVGVSRTSDEDTMSSSNQRLVSSPQSLDQESFESTSSGGRLVSPTQTQQDSRSRRHSGGPRHLGEYHQQPSSNDPSNPFRSANGSYDEQQQTFTPDLGYAPDESLYSATTATPANSRAQHFTAASSMAPRGVQLTDTGPVPAPVRRVPRPNGRRVSQSQNRYSRNSAVINLPPGAAPPQPQFGSS